MAGIAGRRGKPQIELPHIAIDAIEPEPQGTDADAVPLKRRLEPLDQSSCRRDDDLLCEDRVEEGAPDMIDGRWRNIVQDFRPQPQRLVEAVEQLLLETCREGRARRIDQHADALEAETMQGGMSIGTEPQGLEGERAQRFFLFSFRQSIWQRGSMMGKRPGGAWRAGNGAARGEMEVAQALDEVLEQGRFAAEEMCRSGDVDEEAVAAVFGTPGRDGGRITCRPQRQAAQRTRILVGFEGAGLQEAAGLGARIAQALAGEEADPLGGRIRGGDARAARRIDGQDERPVRRYGSRRVLRCQKAQDRPSRQPD